MTAQMPSADQARGWRGPIIAVLLASVVFLPRAMLVAAEHGRTWDEAYHIETGLAVLTQKSGDRHPGDPSLGQAVLALPMLALNALYGEPLAQSDIHHRRFSALTAQRVLYAWKVLLFLPAIAVLFVWCRSSYGQAAAFLAVALVSLDPTFAAHVPIPALDALGAEAVLITSWLYWRCLRQPSRQRIAVAAIATAIAMHVKHSAFVLPVVAACFLGFHVAAVVGTAVDREARVRFLRKVGVGAAWAIALYAVSFWALTGFDVSPPGAWLLKYEREKQTAAMAAGKPVVFLAGAEKVRAFYLDRPWPAGWYLGTLIHAAMIMKYGHNYYLLGQHSVSGWWFYQPVVATYKVPLGFMAVLSVGAIMAWRKRSWADVGFVVPAAVLGTYIMWSGVSIGFRHFLACYQFLLALGAQAAANSSRLVRVVVWTCLALGGLHGLSYHPDYISYVNFPRDRPYLDISESNIDWGQSLPQLRRWIDTRSTKASTITLSYFGSDSVEAQLGDRVTLRTPREGPPCTGLYVVSPFFVVGKDTWIHPRAFEPLRLARPIDIIGHNLLVFDMDAVTGKVDCPPR